MVLQHNQIIKRQKIFEGLILKKTFHYFIMSFLSEVSNKKIKHYTPVIPSDETNEPVSDANENSSLKCNILANKRSEMH